MWNASDVNLHKYLDLEFAHQNYPYTAILHLDNASGFPDHQYQLTSHINTRTTNQTQYPYNNKEEIQKHAQADPYITILHYIANYVTSNPDQFCPK